MWDPADTSNLASSCIVGNSYLRITSRLPVIHSLVEDTRTSPFETRYRILTRTIGV